ncbi:MAG: flagellar protein [Ignavibacteria bacterium CG2_30_36_16]|nr:flagellar protein [Ignavibacteria bacterium]OIP58736.1 MAG: flagellar protein [Ignavibacteria bacterium CG2_30_36_16]PJA98870.1 MAG: flagellar protein [Ignavibacteria bacterium CG_4_9_14_3_um_filter_36_18]
MAEVNGIKVPFIPIIENQNPFRSKVDSTGAFESVFQRELEKIKFSSHALKRLETRNIQLSKNEMSKIENAVAKAELKGSKDSLVMMDDTVFIINIPNRTVITAMALKGSDENVFTNIDSVVFA